MSALNLPLLLFTSDGHDGAQTARKGAIGGTTRSRRGLGANGNQNNAAGGNGVNGYQNNGAVAEFEDEILVDSGIGGEGSPYGTPPVVLTPGNGAGYHKGGYLSPKTGVSPPKTTLTSSVTSLKALLASPKTSRDHLGVFSLTRNTNV